MSLMPFPLFEQNHAHDATMLAIRGVPRPAISIAASIAGILKIVALLSTIVLQQPVV
jgi:hypothetical protein